MAQILDSTSFINMQVHIKWHLTFDFQSAVQNDKIRTDLQTRFFKIEKLIKKLMNS